jgi:hypothetical protein
LALPPDGACELAGLPRTPPSYCLSLRAMESPSSACCRSSYPSSAPVVAPVASCVLSSRTSAFVRPLLASRPPSRRSLALLTAAFSITCSCLLADSRFRPWRKRATPPGLRAAGARTVASRRQRPAGATTRAAARRPLSAPLDCIPGPPACCHSLRERPQEATRTSASRSALGLLPTDLYSHALRPAFLASPPALSPPLRHPPPLAAWLR